MGHFAYKMSFKPDDMTGPVVIEALDAAGDVVAHGRTPDLLLVGRRPGADLGVGRPAGARTAPAAAMLPKAVAETASAYVPGLGVLYAGGRDADRHRARRHRGLRRLHPGASSRPRRCRRRAPARSRRPVSSVHAVGLRRRHLGRLRRRHGGRRHARALRSDRRPRRVGGAAGGHLPSRAPIRPKRRCRKARSWSAAASTPPATRWPRPASSTPTVPSSCRTLSGPMAAARVGHAGDRGQVSRRRRRAPVRRPAVGRRPAPVAERLVGQSFTVYDVGAQPNRVNATATTMPNGDRPGPRRQRRPAARWRRAWSSRRPRRRRR